MNTFSVWHTYMIAFEHTVGISSFIGTSIANKHSVRHENSNTNKLKTEITSPFSFANTLGLRSQIPYSYT